MNQPLCAVRPALWGGAVFTGAGSVQAGGVQARADSNVWRIKVQHNGVSPPGVAA
ncbi:hypothetical protein ACI3L1_14770 [Deinococcus sp. SM5_A1]|uniref:hypothetical protein n=1 Tax=Deinococcus sp. SM5_A1 TaxID=3379094 RepID=UPI00385C7EAB